MKQLWFIQLVYPSSISAAFVFTAFKDIGLTRLRWEESMSVSPAATMLTGAPLHPHFVPLSGNLGLPIFKVAYGIGACESYVMLAAFKLFGISLMTLRSTEILLALAAGLILCDAARLLFDQRTFYCALPLVLLHSSFILFGKVGFTGVILIQWLLLSIVLWLYARWVVSGRTLFLCAAGAACGLGMYAKLHFAGVFLGAALGHALLFDGIRRAESRKKTLCALMFFILGFSPWIYGNLANDWNALRSLTHLFFYPVDSGTNLHYPLALGLRLRQLASCVSGASVCLEFAAGPWWSAWWKAAAYSPLLLLLLRSVRSQIQAQGFAKPLSLLIMIIVSFVLIASFRGTMLGADHMFVVLSLINVCLAVVLRSVLLRPGILVAALVLCLAPDAATVSNYHVELSSPENISYDREMTRLVDRLLASRSSVPIVIDAPDFGPELNVLSGGRLAPVQARFVFDDRAFIASMRGWLEDKDRLYILIPDPRTDGSTRSALFHDLAKKAGRRTRLVERYFTESHDAFPEVDIWEAR